MKTCFVSRFGGYGDLMHSAHLPKLIKEYYNVDWLEWETGYNGYQILQDNPYIDKLHYVDVSRLSQNRMQKRWEDAKENFDLFFNLVYTIEKAYCLLEKDQAYYRSSEWRREHLGKMNYYDVMTKAVGIPEQYYGTRGRLYYSEKEHEKAKDWVERKKKDYGSDFIVLVCLSGSSLHKRFQQAETVVNSIIHHYPHALVILTGDKNCEPQVFHGERVINKVDKWNFRTVALMCKYFDLVISPETGLVCVSHSWDTPTIQLLTAASEDNHTKYAKNAYPVRSPVECSPCHKGPYKYYGCPRKENLPACVFFNESEILDKVKEVYESSPRTT